MIMRDANGRFISPKKVPQTAQVEVWVDKDYAGTKEDVRMGIMTVEEMKHFQDSTGKCLISKSIITK